jgi:hypothetical protein
MRRVVSFKAFTSTTIRKLRCVSSKPSTTRAEEEDTTGKIPTRRLSGKLAAAPALSPNGVTRMLRITSKFATQPGCRPANARRVASGASSVVFRTSIVNASLKSADGNTSAQSVGGDTAIGRTARSVRPDLRWCLKNETQIDCWHVVAIRPSVRAGRLLTVRDATPPRTCAVAWMALLSR